MTMTSSSPMDTDMFPRQSWRDHLDSLQWAQGEHLLVAAPNKAGKTSMVRHLARKRSHVVVFVTKIKDPTFEHEFRGWTILREWPRNPKDLPDWHTRILLWPRQQKTMIGTLAEQRRVFGHALDAIAHQGNRCVVIDEGLMFTDPKILGFGTQVSMMFYYGRSSGLSLVFLTQRPAWVPVVAYSSVTHAYFARTRDRNDLKRLADMGGIDSKLVGANLARLSSRHDFVYLNPQGDAMSSVVNTRK